MKRNGLRKGILAALAFACILAPEVVFARGWKGPVNVRMEAYVGDPPAGMGLEADWRVDINGTPYQLAVTLLRVQTGKVSAQQIVRSREPYPIAFKASGPTEVVSALTGARSGQRLEILAYLRGGGSVPAMMLSQVRPVGPTPQPTP